MQATQFRWQSSRSAPIAELPELRQKILKRRQTAAKFESAGAGASTSVQTREGQLVTSAAGQRSLASRLGLKSRSRRQAGDETERRPRRQVGESSQSGDSSELLDEDNAHSRRPAGALFKSILSRQMFSRKPSKLSHHLSHCQRAVSSGPESRQSWWSAARQQSQTSSSPLFWCALLVVALASTTATTHGLSSRVEARRQQTAAAEMLARHLLTSYYRSQPLRGHENIAAEAAPVDQQRQVWAGEQQSSDSPPSSWQTASDLMGAPSSGHSAHGLGERLPFGPSNGYPAHGLGLGATGATATTPALNRQLAPPAQQAYEFGLAQTSTIQLEPANAPPQPTTATTSFAYHRTGAPAQGDRLEGSTAHQRGRPIDRFVASGGPTEPTASYRYQTAASEQQQQRSAPNATASNRGARQYSGNEGQSAPGESVDAESALGQTSDSKYDANGGEQASAKPAPLEKGVEPRQRRRMFNRILKKAEWNHLFVELSKVFLRYFLDLALKDIIGKQSGGSLLGSSASSGSDSATTGRKKLDAQSELADLLKEFVKTAISNM